MQVMGFTVWVRVPDNMNANQVSEEIRTSVGFGQAQVVPQFVFPDPPESKKFHSEMLAHDGYASHCHTIRADHLGVHRKEWDDNV